MFTGFSYMTHNKIWMIKKYILIHGEAKIKQEFVNTIEFEVKKFMHKERVI